jgi:hypothetical protein
MAPTTTQKAQVTVMANHMIRQLTALADHQYIEPLQQIDGWRADLDTIEKLLRGEIG